MYEASVVMATISLILNIFSRFFKKQHHSLLVNIFASFFNLLSYLFLTAYMGMIGLIVSTIRSIVFYLFSKNDWEKRLSLLIFFIIAQLGACILTSALSEFILIDFVLVFFKGTLYTYGSWQHNVHIFRWSSIISCIVAIIYNILHLGYMNAASEVFSILALIYIMVKEANAKKKQELTAENSENTNETLTSSTNDLTNNSNNTTDNSNIENSLAD